MKKLLVTFLIFFLSTALHAATTTADEIKIAPSSVIREKMADPDFFDMYISKIRNGDTAWVNTIPYTYEYVTIKQEHALRNAMILSLIKSTPDIIDVMSEVERKNIGKDDLDTQGQLGVNTICAVMIDVSQYDKQSFLDYYSRAKAKLTSIGEKGKDCLDLMNQSVEEILHESKQKVFYWGSEKYDFGEEINQPSKK